MICANCKQEIPDGVRFCTRCGAPVAPKEGERREDPDKVETAKIAAESSPNQTVPMISVVSSAAKTSPTTAQSGSRREKGLLVVTSVLATLAVVAAVVLAVAVFGPLGSGDAQDGAASHEADSQVGTSQVEAQGQKGAADDVDSGEATGTSPSVTSDESGEEGTKPGDVPEGAEGNGGYVLPDSSTYLYTADELSGMSDWELYLARNEIFVSSSPIW